MLVVIIPCVLRNRCEAFANIQQFGYLARANEKAGWFFQRCCGAMPVLAVVNEEPACSPWDGLRLGAEVCRFMQCRCRAELHSLDTYQWPLVHPF